MGNAGFIWAVFQIRVPFRVFFIRVPYHIGDLKRDPSLENYPYHQPYKPQTADSAA